MDSAADREARREVLAELRGEGRLVEEPRLPCRQPRRRARVVRADYEIPAKDPHRADVLRDLNQPLRLRQVALALVVEPGQLRLHPRSSLSFSLFTLPSRAKGGPAEAVTP